MQKPYLRLQTQQSTLTPTRNLDSQVIIGRNVFSSQFLREHQILAKTKDLLARHYIRFEKLEDGTIKIGVEGNDKATDEWMAAFAENLVESSMLGYIFIGIHVPLIKEMAPVQYTRLERIELVKCNLHSIQALTWIDAPNFKTTYLRGNQITSLRPLIKTHWKNFTSIDIDNNPVKDFEPFNRALMPHYNVRVNNKFYIYLTPDLLHTGNFNFLLKNENVDSCVIGQNNMANKYIRHEKTLLAIRKLQTHPRPQPEPEQQNQIDRNRNQVGQEAVQQAEVQNPAQKRTFLQTVGNAISTTFNKLKNRYFYMTAAIIILLLICFCYLIL